MNDHGLAMELFDELLLFNLVAFALGFLGWRLWRGRPEARLDWSEENPFGSLGALLPTPKLGVLLFMAFVYGQASFLIRHFPDFARRLSMVIF